MESVTNYSDQGSFSGDVVRIDESKVVSVKLRTFE